MRAAATQQVELKSRPAYTFDGPLRTGVCVQFYGMLAEANSIGNVSAAVARALVAALPGVALQGYTGTGFFDAGLAAASGRDPAAPIAVFYGVPDFVDESVFAHPTLIGGFVCETDRIPARWVDTCNRFDLILVPSGYCRDVFRGSGVQVPIMVVPHGLEPCYQPVRLKVRREPFVFYNVANAHVPERKSIDELLRSFQRAFQGRRDVQLRLRVQRSSAVRRSLVRYRIGPDDPLIRVEATGPASTEEFAAIYSDVHCTVHPSKSEGFGLIPFQSIACETPVIAPRTTGMADYLDASNAMLLRSKGVCETPNVYYRTGDYPDIDEEHLVELLRYAETRWEDEYARVRRVAPAFRARHTWANALAGIVALVGELAGIDDPAARAARIRARVPAGAG